MSETPITDKFADDKFIYSHIGPYERGHNDGLRIGCEKARELEGEVARLTAKLADMTADRDSWSRQNDDRVADCLRLGKEIEGLKAELSDITADRDRLNNNQTVLGEVGTSFVKEIDGLKVRLADMTADRDIWQALAVQRASELSKALSEIDRLTGELAGRHTGSEVVAWMQWMGETGDNVESWPIDEVTDKNVGIAAWKARQKEER
jgi:hypothetical protein